MEYIDITDVDPNYLKNIELIKENKLIDIFLNSDSEKEKQFYTIILNKVKKINDLESIFNIFQIKTINQGFAVLINSKMNEIKSTILDVNLEKNPKVLNTINDWVNINLNNNLDLNLVFDLLFLNFDIPNKYYTYLIKNRDQNKEIINNFKDKIISVTTECLEEKHTPDLIINILLNSEEELRLFCLEKLNNYELNEVDFFKKDKTKEFILFKAFEE